MSSRPPTLDPQAANRWAQHVPSGEIWLHDEVARRMAERLDLILRQPKDWVHWSPCQGGFPIHPVLVQRYPQSVCHIVEPVTVRMAAARQALEPSWWQAARWRGPQPQFGLPGAPAQMLWANMCLHQAAYPEALMAEWHKALAVDGFLMFSCLGPDTLRELRGLYARAGWPEPMHALTDMHDWGDMLVHAGFAEPVMDMERITLSYSSPESLLQELRTLGRNMHVARFAGLRGRGWHAGLRQRMEHELRRPEGASDAGRLTLTFEVIYGHAFKPQPKVPVAPQSNISLEDMRAVLALGPRGRGKGA